MKSKGLITLCILLLGMLFFSACSSVKQTASSKQAETHQLTEADEQRFYYYYYEALRLRENQQYDQALEAFLLCYSIDPLNAGLHSDLGLLYASIGFMEESVLHFEKAAELQPSNWWYNVRLINLLSERKKYEQAVKLAAELQQKFPYKEDVYFMLASLYTQTQQLNKAIEAYDQLEAIAGMNAMLSFEKYRLYVQSGKPKKGIAEIDKLIEKFPAETQYKVSRGNIYMQQKMPEEALKIYEQVLAEDPQNPYVHIALSDYYNAADQPEKASEAIVNALKNSKLDIDTKVEILGKYIEKLLADEKKIDETEDLFKLLIDYYPLEEQVHAYYAIFLQYQKREEEMAAELQTILYINPQNESAWFQLIQMYFSRRELDKVIETASDAVRNIPDNPLLYFYKSLAQTQLQDYEGALETSLNALSLFTDNSSRALKSDIYSQVGDIYYNMNQKDKAFESYEEALKANPGNIHTMNNYAYYLSLAKENLKHAERLSAKSVEAEPKNSTFLDTYAWILYQQGDYALAKFYIERAMDNIRPEHEPGVIIDHYGDILWKNGEKEKALEMWKKALESGLETDELKLKIEKEGMLE